MVVGSGWDAVQDGPVGAQVMVLVGDDEDHVTNDTSRIATQNLLVVGNDGDHATKDKSLIATQILVFVGHD